MKSLIILFLLPVKLFAQDLSGIWTGWIHTRGNDLSYELVISENLNGYSLTIFTINDIENVGVKSIALKRKNGKISLEDDRLIYNNYSVPGQRIKLFSTLSLKMNDSTMTLSGPFRTRSLDFRSSGNNSYTGTISLQKQKNSEKTRLIAQLDTMNLLNNLSFIQRQTEHEEPFTTAVLVEKPKPNLEIERKRDSTSTTIKEATAIVITRPAENQTDSVSKNETNKKMQDVVAETKMKETVNPVASINKPDRLPPAKQKQVKTATQEIPQKNVQDNIAATKIKESSNAVTSLKEPKQLPAKEKEIDSTAEGITKKNTQAAVTSPIQQLEKKTTEASADIAAAIAERKTEIIRNVFFRSDTLLISLYDNGYVDGDTVSVVLNGKVIIAKQRLSEKAIRLIVQVTPESGDSLLLTMYAENLGSIAPNTGLLIIQDGEERNQIRFEGDLQKSSAIMLLRKR